MEAKNPQRNKLSSKNPQQGPPKMTISLLILLLVGLSLFTAFTIYGMFVLEPFNAYLIAFSVACTAWSFVPISFERMLAPVQQKEEQVRRL